MSPWHDLAYGRGGAFLSVIRITIERSQLLAAGGREVRAQAGPRDVGEMESPRARESGPGGLTGSGGGNSLEKKQRD